MEKKLVIFDCFGVIVAETAPFWFAERFSQDEAKRIKAEIVGEADMGLIGEKELFKILSALTGEDPEEIRRDWYSRAVFNNAVVERIGSLRKKYKVVLLSNAIENMVQNLFGDRLNTMFDRVIISSVEKLAKPDEKIFRLMLERTGFQPEEAVFIDDNPVNIGAAEKIGIEGILFTKAEDLDKLLA